MTLVFKNAVEKFENLLNNTLVDHLQKYGFFSNFQFVFRSSRSTADLQVLIYPGLIKLQNLISKAFSRVWHAGLLHKFKS